MADAIFKAADLLFGWSPALQRALPGNFASLLGCQLRGSGFATFQATEAAQGDCRRVLFLRFLCHIIYCGLQTSVLPLQIFKAGMRGKQAVCHPGVLISDAGKSSRITKTRAEVKHLFRDWSPHPDPVGQESVI
jgi:hypothetical protein